MKFTVKTTEQIKDNEMLVINNRKLDCCPHLTIEDYAKAHCIKIINIGD